MVYFYKLLKLIVLLVLVTLLQNGDLKHQGGGGGAYAGSRTFSLWKGLGK